MRAVADCLEDGEKRSQTRISPNGGTASRHDTASRHRGRRSSLRAPAQGDVNRRSIIAAAAERAYRHDEAGEEAIATGLGAAARLDEGDGHKGW